MVPRLPVYTQLMLMPAVTETLLNVIVCRPGPESVTRIVKL